MLRENLWRDVEVIAQHTSVGIIESSRRFLEPDIELIPCDTLKVHTAAQCICIRLSTTLLIYTMCVYIPVTLIVLANFLI